MDKSIYGLKYSGLEWIEKSSKVYRLEALYSLKWTHVSGFWYKEEMVLLFYLDDCLMFHPSKDKIEKLYFSLQIEFKI